MHSTPHAEDDTGFVQSWWPGVLLALAVLAAGGALALLAHRVRTPDYPPRAIAASEACQRSALAAFPGAVVHSASRLADGRQRLFVAIEGDRAGEAVIMCDGESGRVLETATVGAGARGHDGIK